MANDTSDNKEIQPPHTASQGHPARRSLAARLPLLKHLVRRVLEIDGSFQAMLEREGLADFDGVWAYCGGRMVTRHADRSVFRIELAGTDGPKALYLKRLGRARVKTVVECLRTFQRPLSKCLYEWKWARILGEIGVGGPPMAAAGEVRIGLFPLESFLVVCELECAESLDEFLENAAGDSPARVEKRLLIRRLAETVARMHGAGVFHQDLYAKHIFVRRQGGGFAINIIDLQRMRASGRESFAVRDLAALNVTLSWKAASTAERARFLVEYARARFGKADPARLRRLALAVFKRSLRISSRSKFRGIHWRRQDER